LGGHANSLKGKKRGKIQSALKKNKYSIAGRIKCIFLPFVTPPGAFRPYVKSESTLQKLFTNEILADKFFQKSEYIPPNVGGLNNSSIKK
jgi:hypothetical protein